MFARSLARPPALLPTHLLSLAVWTGSVVPAPRFSAARNCQEATPPEAKRGLYYTNLLRVYSFFNQVCVCGGWGELSE